MCARGKPPHYNDPHIRALVEKMIELEGEEIKVRVGRRTWLAPRHFIALHGLRAADLPDSDFVEVNAEGPLADGESITCPSCGMTSFNSTDRQMKYCGHCHKYHEGETNEH